MYNLARQSSQVRNQVFSEASARLLINESVVEKDYYVVLMLDLLFHQSSYGKCFAFKGGTSLSKAFQVIERFSEDIDLILDWRVLGYELNEPWMERSKKAQLRFNEEAREKTSEWIRNVLLPDLTFQMEKLNLNGFELVVKEGDPRTIEVHYPNSFKDVGILQEIRLEIGPMAAWTPHSDKAIQSYLSKVFPEVLDFSKTIIPTVEAKRTFWEKATILHKEANRKTNFTPKRYSRHYYDLYMMSKTKIKEEAFQDIQLLEKVVKFKMKFFSDNTAKYEEATSNSIKLLPQEIQLPRLREDYKNMEKMMFGEFPSFDEIIDGIERLEREIHQI